VEIVFRHVIPRVAEATVIPSLIFYVVWRFVGVWPALGAALLWAGGLIARRLARGRPVPPLVVIGIIGLTFRTLVTMSTGSTFIYFLQPVLGTTVIAATFLGSVFMGRPLVNRLAREFCPLTDEAASRHGVQRLFRNLTLFWSAVLLTHAAITLSLLLTVSVDTFVLVKTMTGPGLTAAAVTLTVVWSVRVARREGIAEPSRRTIARAAI
jgi:intracellular septation protein A